MYKRKKWLMAFLILVILLFCMGCANKKISNTKTGMDAVAVLDYETALANFEKAVLNGENLELAYRGQGIAYMGLTKYEEAIHSFEKALKSAGMFPGDLEYDINFYMATAKYKMEDTEGAIKILDGILDLQKKNKDAYLLRGSAKVKKGDYENGLKDLEKAMELSGSSVDMLVQVYLVLEQGGHKEEGQAYLTKAMEKGSSLSEYDKGTLAYYLEDYENARNYLETARTDKNVKDTKAGNILSMLGRTYEQLGDRNYAAVLYEEYLKDHADDVVLQNQLGLCKLGAGDYQGALTAFQNALKLESNELTQSLKYNEIVAYEYLGDFDKAKVLMKAYLKAYPDDSSANREYKFLKTR